MSDNKLGKFVREALGINAVMPGTGVSAAGLMGAMSPRQSLVEDLKKQVHTFAAEYSKNEPNQAAIKEMFREIEGTIYGLRSFSVIDDTQTDNLISQLKDLTK